MMGNYVSFSVQGSLNVMEKAVRFLTFRVSANKHQSQASVATAFSANYTLTVGF